jgi:hypothetical protein
MDPIEHLLSKIGDGTHPQGIGMQAGNLSAHYEASGLTQDAKLIYEYALSLVKPDQRGVFHTGFKEGHALYPLSLGDTETPS